LPQNNSVSILLQTIYIFNALICDATFYGKRRDKLGTLVFKDSIDKEILIWNISKVRLSKIISIYLQNSLHQDTQLILSA